MKKIIRPNYLIISIILTLGLSLSLQNVLAEWLAPESSPPGGGIPEILNTGITNQSKLGGLSVGGNMGVGLNLNTTGYIRQAFPAGSNNLTGSLFFGYTDTNNYSILIRNGSNMATPADDNRMLLQNVIAGLGTTGGYIDFRPAGNYTAIYPSGGASGNLLLYSGGSETIRANASGNVGINTTIPGAKLQVNGESGEAIRLVSDPSYSPLNIMNNTNTDIFRVDQTGSLAVGNIPWSRISNYPTACSSGQFISGLGDTITCTTPSASLSGGLANNIVKWTSDTTIGQSAITSDGSSNVGIGNTTPGAKLDVAGNIRQSGLATNGTQITQFGFTDASNYSRILRNGSNMTAPAENNRMLLQNVVAGSGITGGYIDFRPAGNYTAIYPSGGASGNLLLFSGGAETMRMNSSGNVGINTTVPGAKLQVNGEGGEAIRLVSDANFSPLNIRDSGNGTDIFRVDQTGKAYGQTPLDTDPGKTIVTKEYVDNKVLAAAGKPIGCTNFLDINITNSSAYGYTVLYSGTPNCSTEYPGYTTCTLTQLESYALTNCISDSSSFINDRYWFKGGTCFGLDATWYYATVSGGWEFYRNTSGYTDNCTTNKRVLCCKVF